MSVIRKNINVKCKSVVQHVKCKNVKFVSVICKNGSVKCKIECEMVFRISYWIRRK